jgi:hypothetical protein
MAPVAGLRLWQHRKGGKIEPGRRAAGAQEWCWICTFVTLPTAGEWTIFVWTNYLRNIPLCDLGNFWDSGKDAGVAPLSSLSRETSLTLPPD